jgi:hypothetical protein
MLALTREELLEGSQYLAVRSDVLRQIADRLQPGQRVGDRMDEQQLNELVTELSRPALPEAAQQGRNRAAGGLNAAKPYREALVVVSGGSGPETMRAPVSAGAGE